MDFATTPEQDKLVAEVTGFARAELCDRAADNDRAARFDRESWRASAEFGVLGWPVPARVRRSGAATRSPASPAWRRSATAAATTAWSSPINNHLWACTIYLLAHGSDGPAARGSCPALADGTAVGAHAMTEPEAGSDVLALAHHRAARRASTTSSTGSRPSSATLRSPTCSSCSPAPAAPTPPRSARCRRSSCRATRPGLTAAASGPRPDCAARRWGSCGSTGAAVPAANRLGAEGAGYQIFTSDHRVGAWVHVRQPGRPLQRILETAAAHAGRRRQFGRPIGAFQAVSHQIADMRVGPGARPAAAVQVRLAQAAGPARAAGVRDPQAVRQRDRSCGRRRSSGGCTAPVATSTDFGVEREVRDALASTIYGGTSDIQRNDHRAACLGLPLGRCDETPGHAP